MTKNYTVRIKEAFKKDYEENYTFKNNEVFKEDYN